MYFQISGAIRDDGTINWECPCIQREVVGPCGVEFRTAFSAYVDMKNEGQTKPSDTFMTAIKSFNTCAGKFPEYYMPRLKDDTDNDDDDFNDDNLDIPEPEDEGTDIDAKISQDSSAGS